MKKLMMGMMVAAAMVAAVAESKATVPEVSTSGKSPLTADAPLKTSSNHSGGIQGGLSNGQDITMRIAFKPVATILMEQPTVDASGKATVLKAKGRHDPCVLPRAVPIVEAMAAMTILDCYLSNKCAKL